MFVEPQSYLSAGCCSIKATPDSAPTLTQGLTTPIELEGSMKPTQYHRPSATKRGL